MAGRTSYDKKKGETSMKKHLEDTERSRSAEYQYLNLLKDILKNGSDKPLFFTPEVLDQYKKKGEKPPFIRSVFGREMRFDLSKGFHLLTTKKVFTRGVIIELLWFLRGDSNIKFLVDNNVHIWDEWAYKRFYKSQSQKLKVKSQKYKSKVKTGVTLLTQDDFIYAMASKGNANEVPPFCHTMYQFAVTNGMLNCALYQRSADMFLGVPFNIASYSLLLLMVSQVTGIPAGEFVHFFGDAHIYSNHFDQVKEQLKRKPRPFPKMKINPKLKNIDDIKFEDFALENYDPHPALKADIANIGGF